MLEEYKYIPNDYYGQRHIQIGRKYCNTLEEVLDTMASARGEYQDILDDNDVVDIIVWDFGDIDFEKIKKNILDVIKENEGNLRSKWGCSYWGDPESKYQNPKYHIDFCLKNNHNRIGSFKISDSSMNYYDEAESLSARYKVIETLTLNCVEIDVPYYDYENKKVPFKKIGSTTFYVFYFSDISMFNNYVY